MEVSIAVVVQKTVNARESGRGHRSRRKRFQADAEVVDLAECGDTMN